MNGYKRWLPVGEFARNSHAVVLEVVSASAPCQHAAPKQCLSTDPADCAALRQEIANIKLNLLPGRMTRLLDEGEDTEGRPYYVMPPSRDVTTLGKTEDNARRLALFLIDCAIELRERGYIHGDLKPDNVGLETDDNSREHLVLRDWATLRRLADANCQHAVVGSFFFRAQEVDYAGICDEQTEIHAIGISFFGRLPIRKRFIYALPILQAVCPRPWRYRRYEDLQSALVAAPQTFRHLVALSARLRRFGLAVRGTVLAILGVIGLIIAALLILYFVRRNTYMKTDRATAHVMANVDAGLYHRRAGNFKGAVARLEAAVNHPAFEKTGYKHGEVFRILAECYRDGKGVAPDPVKSQYYRLRGNECRVPMTDER